MKMFDYPGFKAVDLFLIGAVLLSFVLFVGAANVTINATKLNNTVFSVGTECVFDNVSNNSYCFTKFNTSLRLSCPAFGQPAVLNYSNDSIGVFVDFDAGLCNSTNATIIQKVNTSIKIDLKKDLRFNECYNNLEVNLSVCGPSGSPEVVFLKKGDIYNRTDLGLMVLTDNESFIPLPSPTPTAAPVCNNDGACGNGETSENCALDCPLSLTQKNSIPTPAPAQQGEPINYILLFGVIAVSAYGYHWYMNKNKTEGGTV